MIIELFSLLGQVYSYFYNFIMESADIVWQNMEWYILFIFIMLMMLYYSFQDVIDMILNADNPASKDEEDKPDILKDFDDIMAVEVEESPKDVKEKEGGIDNPEIKNMHYEYNANYCDY